jgi:hypothetical protein
MKPKTIAIALSVALLAGLASLDAVAGKGGAGEVVVSSTGVRAGCSARSTSWWLQTTPRTWAWRR